jgi:branched-chain amino acid aminotransferase
MTTIIYNHKTILSNKACIKHNDRGFTLGHGLFETILVKKSIAWAIDYHWYRLETSAPLIGITLPFSKQELTKMISALINKNNLQDKIAGARVTITHGESDRGILPITPLPSNFVISVFEYTHLPKADFSALIATTRKNEYTIAARIKSISYLDNILAKQEAISQGYDEAILLNTASNVADGAITNVFMVKNNKIYTPSIADGALPGVIRSILLEELNTEFPVIEKSISEDELLSADEVFLTNALMGIQPVSHINSTKYEVFITSLALTKKLRDVKNYIAR